MTMMTAIAPISCNRCPPNITTGPVSVAPTFPQGTQVSLPRMARLGLRAGRLTLAFNTPKLPHHITVRE
jgi:hypothetical protein